MARGPCKVTQRDITRTFKAAKAANVGVKIEIEDGRGRKMTIIMDRNSATENEKDDNEWNEVFDDKDQT